MNPKKYIINIFVLGFLLSFVQFSYALWVVPEDSDVSGVLKMIRSNNQIYDTVEIFNCTDIHGNCELIQVKTSEELSLEKKEHTTEFMAKIIGLVILGAATYRLSPLVLPGGMSTSVTMIDILTVVGTPIVFSFISKRYNLFRLWDYIQVYDDDLLMNDEVVITFSSDTITEIAEKLSIDNLNNRPSAQEVLSKMIELNLQN